MEGDDVFMFELFHEGDFADGGAGCAFFAVEVDLFEGDEFACLPIATFEDLMAEADQFGGKGEGWLRGLLLLHRFPRPAAKPVSSLPVRHRFDILPFPAAGRSWDVSCPCLDS